MSDDLNSLIQSIGRQADANVLKKGTGPIAAPDRTGPNTPSYVAGFLKSTLGAAAETMGAPTTLANEQFRAENPTAGVVSQLAGAAVPYVGYAAATHKLPPMQKALDSVAGQFETPLMQSAAKNAARFAPLEAARVAGAAVMNPDAVGETAGSAAINLGVEAALGALGGLLTAGGKSLSAADKARADLTDLKQSPQFQIADLKEKLSGGSITPEDTYKVSNKIKALE